MRVFAIAVIGIVVLASCGVGEGADGDSVTLRLGYFPNVTHAPAIVGMEEGILTDALGSGVVLEPHAFNAGPEVVEAIFNGALDASFIGPNPAINAFAQSEGQAIRIVSGATSGGAALIVRDDITSASAWRPRSRRRWRHDTMGISLTPEERLEVFGDHDPDQHAAEVEERWGKTDALRVTASGSSYSKADWLAEVRGRGVRPAVGGGDASGAAPDSEAAMDAAEEHRQHISRGSRLLVRDHVGLGEMYVADPRFTATYEAIARGSPRSSATRSRPTPSDTRPEADQSSRGWLAIPRCRSSGARWVRRLTTPMSVLLTRILNKWYGP